MGGGGGGTQIWWIVETEPRMIAQVAYVLCEGIKSDVVSWGHEFMEENNGSHARVYTLVIKEWSLNLYS